MKAKVPLAQGLSLLEILFSFIPLQKALASTTGHKKRRTFWRCVKKRRFFERRLHAFIEIGEATHQLEEIFSEMVHYYNTKIEQQTKRLTVFEPTIIIIVRIFTVLSSSQCICHVPIEYGFGLINYCCI